MNLDEVVRQLQDERQKIDKAITALSGVQNRKYVRRTMSKEARERIRQAQIARWKKQKKAA